MNFQEFRYVLGREKVFSTQDIAKEWSDFNFNNLINWQKKGYIQKIRNKWYTFPQNLKSEEDLF
ncbi:MAG TPA: hypothetical protein VJ933_12270, partial [Phaeodactylibacter sp.]|nr:hypothetical protein [Phaeodactylibacter sp.]